MVDSFESNDIRLVGFGVIASAVVLMVYEVTQIGLESILHNFPEPYLSLYSKVLSVIPAIFIGWGLILWFKMTHRRN